MLGRILLSRRKKAGGGIRRCVGKNAKAVDPGVRRQGGVVVILGAQAAHHVDIAAKLTVTLGKDIALGIKADVKEYLALEEARGDRIVAAGFVPKLKGGVKILAANGADRKRHSSISF